MALEQLLEKLSPASTMGSGGTAGYSNAAIRNARADISASQQRFTTRPLSQLVSQLQRGGGAGVQQKWLPVQGSGRGGQVANAALRMLGKPYVWGGTTVNGVDCSGLVYLALKQAGINSPRLRASGYGRQGQAIGVGQARAGDVVYFDNPGDTDHVGIYLGNGQFVEAPEPGKSVRVSPLRGGAQLRRY